MSTLIVRHVPESDPLQFQVLEPDGEPTAPVELRPAAGFPVAGRPTSDLMAELRWYLETFLEYPFHPETEHAERVLAALRSWSEDAFAVLFENGGGQALFERATQDGEAQLRLRIESADPRVLSWPWESLHQPGAGPLGRLCQVERSLGTSTTTTPTGDLPRDRRAAGALPDDKVNILLVTARPFEDDVGFRSVSRPVIDLEEEEELPVDVHVLRPPTFERLREHLRERPRYYHILHFDGHGIYRPNQPEGEQGRLVFEDTIGGDEEIYARELSELIRTHAVPVVVLNACQSAMLDDAAETAFASVAASLVAAGARSVVAMAYSLRVSGAREFLPDFYRGLFASGSVAEGVRAGRQRMFEQQGRVCARGRFDLEDWLIPVLYQQEDVDFSFAAEARRAANGEGTERPVAVVGLEDEQPLKGFVGRDGAILELERALRRPQAGILVHGLGGVGKTTLTHGFVEWLARTEGLGMGCFWITFQEVRSAEYVWNRLGERFVGPQIALMEAEQKIELLARVFKEQRFLIVWDNFEVVAGIEGTTARPTLSDEDRGQLCAFLAALRGGSTKVLITSRSEERWLGSELRKVSLSGLRGEDRWVYCEQILGDLKVDVDRTDPDLTKLMELLGGHPLAMRVILSELQNREAAEMIQALTDVEADDAIARLHATLGFTVESLDAKLCPLLVPLAFHERFVDGDYLEDIAQWAESSLARTEIDGLLHALASAGLLRDLGKAIFEMHPALTGFLRSSVLPRTKPDVRERWARAFVEVFARLADHLAPRKFHEQRFSVHLHGANFLGALTETERLGMLVEGSALLQALGAFAQNQHLFVEAEKQYEKFAELVRKRREPGLEAGAYHQLGIVAEERRDFDAAEKWLQRSLKIKEKFGSEHGVEGTYYHLSIVAQERRDFDAAERWLQRSLKISEELGNEHGAKITYHRLGMIARERRDFDAAERWCQKSLKINEKLGNEHDATIIYHLLGMIAQERRDFDAAERWYLKSLKISEKLGNEHHTAGSYQNLGSVAEERRDFDAAERWYLKSLKIKEKLGDEHGAASIYDNLGMIARECRDFDAAERWCQKSLNISEKLDNEHGAAGTYHRLGRIAEERRDFDAAERWLQKSLEIKEKLGDEHGAASIYHHFGRIAEERSDFDAAERWLQKSLEIKEKLGDERGAASTYHHFGRIAGVQERHETSGLWFLKSIQGFQKVNDPTNAQQAASGFMITFNKAPPTEQAKLRALWDATSLPWPEDTE